MGNVGHAENMFLFFRVLQKKKKTEEKVELGIGMGMRKKMRMRMEAAADNGESGSNS